MYKEDFIYIICINDEKTEICDVRYYQKSRDNMKFYTKISIEKNQLKITLQYAICIEILKRL